MTIYLDMINAAIKKVRRTIGGAAVTIARRVDGLDVGDDGTVTSCKIAEDDAFSMLVTEYEKMMGDVALTICSMAVESVIAPQCPKLKPPYKIEVRITK